MTHFAHGCLIFRGQLPTTTKTSMRKIKDAEKYTFFAGGLDFMVNATNMKNNTFTRFVVSHFSTHLL